MEFRTELSNINIAVTINHKDKLVMLGSCFSEHIASKLHRYKFDVLSNPFGIIYNPVSIAKIMQMAIKSHYPKKKDFIQYNGLWHNFDFHGDMSGINPNEAIRKSIIFLDNLRDYLTTSSTVFITLGTSIVYKRNDTDDIVANNHKFPADFFTKTRLEIPDIVNKLTQTITALKSINPKVNIIFTVSPVRHIKDGIIENQRSKSILLLSVEKLLSIENCYYFPSYELLLDDLRDYRFYSRDLVHPSETAFEYIMEKFSKVFFDKNTIEINKKIEKITKSLEHKPINPESKSHKIFESKLKNEIKEFQKKYPYINF